MGRRSKTKDKKGRQVYLESKRIAENQDKFGKDEQTMRRRNQDGKTRDYERAVYRGHSRPGNLYFLIIIII